MSFRSRFISKLRALSVRGVCERVTVVGAVGGSIYGACVGVDDSVQSRRTYQSRFDHLMDGFFYALAGGLVGGVAGFAWPISVPVMLYTRAKRSK